MKDKKTEEKVKEEKKRKRKQMADMAGWMFHVWSYSKKKRRKKKFRNSFRFWVDFGKAAG